MSTKKKKSKIFVAIVISLLIIVFVWLENAKCLEQYTRLIGFADGIVQAVSPPPNSKISFGCYTRKNLQNIEYHYLLSDVHNKTNWVESGGINIRIISNNELVRLELSPLAGKNIAHFKDRVVLYLDNTVFQSTTVWSEQDAALTSSGAHPELAGSYIFGSNIFLFPGEHNVKLVINTKSGESIEYEWSFTITWN